MDPVKPGPHELHPATGELGRHPLLHTGARNRLGSLPIFRLIDRMPLLQRRSPIEPCRQPNEKIDAIRTVRIKSRRMTGISKGRADFGRDIGGPRNSTSRVALCKRNGGFFHHPHFATSFFCNTR